MSASSEDFIPPSIFISFCVRPLGKFYWHYQLPNTLLHQELWASRASWPCGARVLQRAPLAWYLCTVPDEQHITGCSSCSCPFVLCLLSPGRSRVGLKQLPKFEKCCRAKLQQFKGSERVCKISAMHFHADSRGLTVAAAIWVAFVKESVISFPLETVRITL